MTYAATKRIFSVKTLIRAAFTAMSIASIGVAHSETFHTPAHNFHQNNWMDSAQG